MPVLPSEPVGLPPQVELRERVVQPARGRAVRPPTVAQLALQKRPVVPLPRRLVATWRPRGLLRPRVGVVVWDAGPARPDRLRFRFRPGIGFVKSTCRACCRRHPGFLARLLHSYQLSACLREKRLVTLRVYRPKLFGSLIENRLSVADTPSDSNAVDTVRVEYSVRPSKSKLECASAARSAPRSTEVRRCRRFASYFLVRPSLSPHFCSPLQSWY